MKKILDYLLYLVVRTFVFFLNLLPLETAQWIAGQIGIFLYKVLKKRRQRALENLRAAFSDEKTEDEIENIARESFRSMAMLAPEFLQLPKLVRNGRLDEIMEVHRDGIVRDVLKQGRGVVFLIFHYGNWEFMGVRAAKIGLPTSAIGRPLKNPYLYNFVRNIRSITGMKNMDKDGALKDAIRTLKKAECVAVLCDQNGRAQDFKIPFFGRRAHTFSTPIALALQTNSEVIPVTCVRQGLGHFYCWVHDPVRLVREGDREQILVENLTRMNQTIENIIREHPEQWLWMHNRWRLKN